MYWLGCLDGCVELYVQWEVFVWYIDLVKWIGKLLMIYNCQVDCDVLDVLWVEGVLDIVILYCFLLDVVMVCMCVDVGWLFSLFGMVSFCIVCELWEVVLLMLVEQFLVEIDVLYLILYFYWGLVNELYCLFYIVWVLVELVNWCFEEVVFIIISNVC